MVLRRIGVMSCAKMMTILYALFGLIVGVFFSLLGLVPGCAQRIIRICRAQAPCTRPKLRSSSQGLSRADSWLLAEQEVLVEVGHDVALEQVVMVEAVDAHVVLGR